LPPNEPAIHSIDPLNFPDPGPLDGIRSRVKTVMKMVNVSFKYETAASPILTDATVRLTLGSRVALVGLNGAGACAAQPRAHLGLAADAALTDFQAKPRC
jgi:ABC-type multidrug transport system fused ATPase/permease subunit